MRWGSMNVELGPAVVLNERDYGTVSMLKAELEGNEVRGELGDLET
jgi:hypothetical protein